MAVGASSIDFEDPSQKTVDRGSDLESFTTGDLSTITFRSPSKISKRTLISVVIFILLIVLCSIIIVAFTSYTMSPEDFAVKLSDHMDRHYPDMDKKLRDSYKRELNEYFKKGFISENYSMEAETLIKYEQFLKDYNRKYDNDERQSRFFIFREKYFDITNPYFQKTYTKGINKFSDRTIEERRKLLSTEIPIKHKNANISQEAVTMINQHLWDPKYLAKLKKAKNFAKNITDPTLLTGEDLDWRRADVVTHIKDQGEDCGSCWAFATVASVESLYKLLKDNTLDLSEQYLLDCEDRCLGCSGGFVDYGLDFIKNRGLTDTKTVPYQAKDQRCPHIEKEKYYIDQFSVMNGKDILNKCLILSPTIVNIGASDRLFDYKGGIYDDECSVHLNHSVLLVGEGYDEKTDKRYWIIKNSWGQDWGEDGYMRLERTNEGDDKCGILTVGLNPYLNHRVANEHVGNMWF